MWPTRGTQVSCRYDDLYFARTAQKDPLKAGTLDADIQRLDQSQRVSCDFVLYIAMCKRVLDIAFQLESPLELGKLPFATTGLIEMRYFRCACCALLAHG
jgi:hypothetical protein